MEQPGCTTKGSAVSSCDSEAPREERDMARRYQFYIVTFHTTIAIFMVTDKQTCESDRPKHGLFLVEKEALRQQQPQAMWLCFPHFGDYNGARHKEGLGFGFFFMEDRQSY
ncbi:unnamed protein product [Lepidochelys kempii]